MSVVGPDVKMESTPILTLGKLSCWSWSPSGNIKTISWSEGKRLFIMLSTNHEHDHIKGH
jgi:hypothetical protein